MRTLDAHFHPGLNELIRIEPGDEPVKGEPHAKYNFWLRMGNSWEKHGEVRFQRGPLRNIEGDAIPPNGLSDDALLAVVLDRLGDSEAGKHVQRALDVLAGRKKK